MTLATAQEGLRLAEKATTGWTRIEAKSNINNPPIGMQVVCGRCSAVLTRIDRYGWADHESCGPMGGECWGGGYKTFRGGWIKDGKFKISEPTTQDDPEYIAHARTHYADLCRTVIALAEALKRLEEAADPHHPLVGLTQPITVAEGNALCDAVLFARNALAKLGQA